jgi:hypothetical protein
MTLGLKTNAIYVHYLIKRLISSCAFLLGTYEKEVKVL